MDFRYIGSDVNRNVLQSFTDREFGIIKGKVKSISLTPDKDGNLLNDVSLPNGIKTSYGRKLFFSKKCPAFGDIVTGDLRLIERLLYQFRDIL